MKKTQNKSKELFDDIKRRYLLLLNDSVIKSTIHDNKYPYSNYQSVHSTFSRYNYFHTLTPTQQVSLVNFVLENNLAQYAGFRDSTNLELILFYKNKDVFTKVRNNLLNITDIDYSFINTEVLSFLGKEISIEEKIRPLVRKDVSILYQGGLREDEMLYSFWGLTSGELQKIKDSVYFRYLNGYDCYFVLGYNPEKHCFYIVRCKYNGLTLNFGTEVAAVAVYVKSSFMFYEKNVLPSFDKYYKNTYIANGIEEGKIDDMLQGGIKAEDHPIICSLKKEAKTALNVK